MPYCLFTIQLNGATMTMNGRLYVKFLYRGVFWRLKRSLRMRRVTWPVSKGSNNHIFGIFAAILSVNYRTFMGLRWRLRAVCRWEFYTGAFLAENFSPFLGPIFNFGGIFQGLDINFEFPTPKNTLLRETASFEPLRVKIRRSVWPVGRSLEQVIWAKLTWRATAAVLPR